MDRSAWAVMRVSPARPQYPDDARASAPLNSAKTFKLLMLRARAIYALHNRDSIAPITLDNAIVLEFSKECDSVEACPTTTPDDRSSRQQARGGGRLLS